MSSRSRLYDARMMRDAAGLLFTASDAWRGGAYELAMQLGPTDDARLRSATEALWSFPALEGCYLEIDVEPSAQRRILLSEGPVDLDECLRGRASLPSGHGVACSTVAVRPEGEADWLFFGLSMGSLAKAYPVGAFPIEDGTSLAWREAIDGWLKSLAAHVHERVGFQLGLVGWTDGAQDTAASIAANGVPEDRWFGYLLPDRDRLVWHPPNQGAPMSMGQR